MLRFDQNVNGHTWKPYAAVFIFNSMVQQIFGAVKYLRKCVDIEKYDIDSELSLCTKNKIKCLSYTFFFGHHVLYFENRVPDSLIIETDENNFAFALKKNKTYIKLARRIVFARHIHYNIGLENEIPVKNWNLELAPKLTRISKYPFITVRVGHICYIVR